MCGGHNRTRTYTDVGLPAWTPIKKDHVEELRRQSGRLSVAGGGGGTGVGAAVEVDGWQLLSFDPATNRINSAGWEYDAAGSLTRGFSPSGVWLRYEYDAVGRPVRVKDDAGNTL